jgi:hypothetical protein
MNNGNYRIKIKISSPLQQVKSPVNGLIDLGADLEVVGVPTT